MEYCSLNTKSACVCVCMHTDTDPAQGLLGNQNCLTMENFHIYLILILNLFFYFKLNFISFFMFSGPSVVHQELDIWFLLVLFCVWGEKCVCSQEIIVIKCLFLKCIYELNLDFW